MCTSIRRTRPPAAPRLVIDAVREPCINFDHPYRGYPAVLVMRAVKP